MSTAPPISHRSPFPGFLPIARPLAGVLAGLLLSAPLAAQPVSATGEATEAPSEEAVVQVQEQAPEKAEPTDPTDPAAEPPPEAPISPGSLEDRARQEVEGLHRFFQDWFNGEVPETDEAFGRFSGVLGESFAIVNPLGQLLDRATLVERLRSSYAPENTEPIRIWIEGFELRQTWPGEDGDLVLVIYEEWQQREGSRQRRLSSAWLRERADTPNGLEWLHVHQTGRRGR